MRASVIAAMAYVVLLAPSAGCDDDSGDAPTIYALVPDAAGAGDPLEITGANFCAGNPGVTPTDPCTEPPQGSVVFGTTARGTVSSWSDTRISLTVPDEVPKGATTVVVMVNDVPSNAVPFEGL